MNIIQVLPYWILFLKTALIRIVITLSNDSEIPKIVYELCPYANICNKSPSRLLSGENLVSCCSSCYCDQYCGLRLDCCFDHMDNYKLKDKRRVVCVDSVVRFENYVQKDKLKNGYLMVTTCDFDKVDTEKVRECNFTDNYGNSTFAPVSDFERNLIFINKECALCNSVSMSKLKPWNYLYRSPFQRLDSLDFNIQTSLKNQLATYLYVPPLRENWLNKRCYNDIVSINKCDFSNEVAYTCNHLRALYRNAFGIIHNNVACQLCTGIDADKISTECDLGAIKGTKLFRFSMLLNKEVIDISKMSDEQMAKNKLINETMCYPEKEIKGTCMAIYCPEGMLQTRNGCVYFALKWFIPWTMLQVKLLPKFALLTELELLILGPEERLKPFMWLKVPCRRSGITSLELFYSISENTIKQKTNGNETAQYVTSLIARIWKSFDVQKGMDPSVMIPVFNKCATGVWEATLWNKVYRFDAYFDKYISYIQDGQTRKTKWPPEGKSTDKEASPSAALYTKVVEGPVRVSDFRYVGIQLKKPYFCNQVHIPSHDIHVRLGEIFIISRNITLGTNEYIVNYPVELGNDKMLAFNESTYSVCVEDYYQSFASNLDSTTNKDPTPWNMIFVFYFCYFSTVMF